jgi:T5SS/PEP-CTERM-associated repeat protein
VVTGAGSIWNCSSEFHIGGNGSSNELDILNGGLVTDSYGTIGYMNSSWGNVVMVSDPGSLWRAPTLYVGLGFGTNNQLIVTNGGTVTTKQRTNHDHI